jgi:hypothetical protein
MANTMTDATAGTFRLGDVFTKAFAIFGRRFVPFIILTVIAEIPEYLTLITLETSDVGPLSGWRMAAVVVNLICSPIATGAVVYGVIQELRGRSFSLGESLQVALQRLLPMIGLAICVGLLTGLATILLIVPGLMVACRYYVAMPACLAEQTGVFDSMSRSAFLTKGYRWQVLGMLILIFIGGAIIEGIVWLIFRASGPFALQIALQPVLAIVGAFNGVIVGVYYYQLRVAKEGVDIDRIASVFD